jgi:xanthine dehydrogenase accessory factor
VENQEQFVLNQLLKWLRRGDQVWLCTIVGTTGSSPRPLGSMLVVNQHGEIAGSLSGGCVEDDLIEKLRGGERLSLPLLREYGVTAEENERLGLPCGGRLHVLIEPVAANAEMISHFEFISSVLAQRKCCERSVDLKTGSVQVVATDRVQRLQISEGTMRQSFGPHYQLLLVGAGQLARTLAQMAQMLDYRVMVCDPREDRIEQWDLPDIELIQGMPDDVVRERASDDHSIVITLTHDPRIDDMALMEALTLPLFYVGALGSQRTTSKRRDRLLQLGLTAEQLARLNAPVGLDIGSKTPGEIAVSILAQLTAMRFAKGVVRSSES